MTTFAFTGHRPKDLPQGFGFTRFAITLDQWLGMTNREPSRFITGGALGIDTYAADFAINHNIPFTLILPFRPAIMANFWTEMSRDKLTRHIGLANDVQIVHDEDSYDVRAYQERNIQMVNRADEVIAFWTGKNFGGTKNCIDYALSVNKPVHNLLR